MVSTDRHRAGAEWIVTTSTVAVVVCLFAAVAGPCKAADDRVAPPIGPMVSSIAIPAVPLPGLDPTGEPLPSFDVTTRVRSDDALRVPDRRGSSFVHEHLVPELTDRFRPLSTRSPLGVLGLGAPDSNASRELADVVGHGAGKAAERAVTDWLLEVTDIEARALAWVAGPRERLGLGESRGSSSSSPRRPGISVGISRGLPRTALTWTVGESSTVRLSLRAYGAAAIEFRRRGERREYWVAGWDGDRDRYRLQYRLAF